MHVLLQPHTTEPDDLHTGKINLRELTLVRSALLPPAIVAMVPLEELHRRKEEIDAVQPELADETRWVVTDEERRRHRARQPRMRILV